MHREKLESSDCGKWERTSCGPVVL